MHQHGDPARPVDPRDHWEDFYGDGKRPWSGKPNAILVDETAGLQTAGRTALDLGCGSGADAIWLAQQGWSVTAVDIAEAALAVGREHAREAGLPDEAIAWRRVDLSNDFPVGTWDLVSAFYLHSQVELARADILRKAAAAVAPGGSLLVVGHWGMPDFRFDGDPPEFPSTDDVLADIGAAPTDPPPESPAATSGAASGPESAATSGAESSGWTTIHIGLAEVAMTDPEGNPCARTDNVVHLRRN
ncbi:hypothetical protein GOARA_057_00330 [Gordonia araii NBRC 100433]|uniref:Methyltransferase domain-containing protein n=1 Tax=Gordonia araii NBRC 100433 TaxID=1073574 RepID=G7H3T4_9ACTN|nr:class I SAM-dependent methyltransferase [Gordonia araii]NNG98670.1 class I SAM-dependent methyltransferase [Gordonia araii NBRC 100433]GAB10509.1 hypothetical protein GOARA_057_00330 [Gordonia araii NBRC 100433]